MRCCTMQHFFYFSIYECERMRCLALEKISRKFMANNNTALLNGNDQTIAKDNSTTTRRKKTKCVVRSQIVFVCVACIGMEPGRGFDSFWKMSVLYLVLWSIVLFIACNNECVCWAMHFVVEQNGWGWNDHVNSAFSKVFIAVYSNSTIEAQP